MLEHCKQLYESSGNSDGVEYCAGKLGEIEAMKQAAIKNVSSLGWMIDDKPELRRIN